MRLMCLNAWGGTLADDLLPYLAGEAPDILCLQEVVHSPTSDHRLLTYRDGDHVLSQRANLFREVATILPEHQAMFCPAAEGVLWDKDTAIASQWGLATFVAPDIPVIGQMQGFVHKGFSAHGYGDHPRSRSAHAVRVWHTALDRAVSVTQMHGLRDLRGKMDTPERAAQADRLLAMSEQVSEDGDLRIICGDFNVEPGSETLERLRKAGFTELVTDEGHAGTRTSHYQKPGRFADYLAITEPGAVLDFDVVRSPEISDHCPLVLTI